MPGTSELELLPPHLPEGYHRRRGERIERRAIEIGKGKFLEGVDVGSLRWPGWPHIVVTDLPRSRKDWLGLDLPEELRLIQEVIGREESLAHAATLFLPAETQRAEELRELLASQSYILGA